MFRVGFLTYRRTGEFGGKEPEIHSRNWPTMVNRQGSGIQSYLNRFREDICPT